MVILLGYYLSHADLAGPFSGTLFGLTNTMAQIPGFANALIVAHLTTNVSLGEISEPRNDYWHFYAPGY